jgi:phage shock protein A
MASLFDKVRVAVLGKMHSLLDEVANTPEAYKQRIRDLQSALADLRAAKDEAVGTVNGYNRQITAAQGSQASKQADIDLLLGDDDPSNDDAALQLQVEVDELNEQVASLQDLQAQSQSTVDDLDTALGQLESKHREMVNGLNKLTLTAAATKAKTRAATAAEAAVNASNAAGDVDSIQARLDHDNDVANARFARVIGGMQSNSSPEQAAKLARAKAALEARRAQITQQATQASSVGAPTA